MPNRDKPRWYIFYTVHKADENGNRTEEIVLSGGGYRTGGGKPPRHNLLERLEDYLDQSPHGLHFTITGNILPQPEHHSPPADYDGPVD